MVACLSVATLEAEFSIKDTVAIHYNTGHDYMVIYGLKSITQVPSDYHTTTMTSRRSRCDHGTSRAVSLMSRNYGQHDAQLDPGFQHDMRHIMCSVVCSVADDDLLYALCLRELNVISPLTPSEHVPAHPARQFSANSHEPCIVCSVFVRPFVRVARVYARTTLRLIYWTTEFFDRVSVIIPAMAEVSESALNAMLMRATRPERTLRTVTQTIPGNRRRTTLAPAPGLLELNCTSRGEVQIYFYLVGSKVSSYCVPYSYDQDDMAR